ncbi:MAG: SDR family oxidoreductase [Gemmatimonas sp.]
MILIVGGTGNLGGHVVEQLLSKGERVRVMTRDPSRARMLKDAGVQVVKGDLRDEQSLRAATQDVRVVISSSHSLLGARASSSLLVDDAGQHQLIHAAEDAGAEQFLYVSALGASPHHPVDFWRTKARIEQFLRSRAMRYTIVRPGAYMRLHAYELIGKAVLNSKPVILFGPGTHLTNYVAERDVAKLLISAIGTNALDGETIEIGGPENLSGNQVVAVFEKLYGRKARVVRVPIALPRLLSACISPVHEGIGRLLHAAGVAPTQDMTFNPVAFLQRFPVTLTSLEVWAREHATQATSHEAM